MKVTEIDKTINKKVHKWTDEQLLSYLTNNLDSMVKAVGIEVETRWNYDLFDYQELQDKIGG